MPDLHLRKQMRARAIGTTLASLASVPVARVHDSLVYPLQTLPALRFGFEDEDINVGEQRAGQAGRATLLRTVELVIEICVKEITTYEDKQDEIQLEVEQAVAADATLGGLAKNILPLRVETDRSGEGDKPVAVRRLVFGVFYATAQNAPQTPL